MARPKLTLALAALGLAWACSAEAQMTVSGARVIGPASPELVVHGRKVVVKTPRSERNRYFAARPDYAPVDRGARANITFEPFTRWYYPNENSYYPPVRDYPSIRSR